MQSHTRVGTTSNDLVPFTRRDKQTHRQGHIRMEQTCVRKLQVRNGKECLAAPGSWRACSFRPSSLQLFAAAVRLVVRKERLGKVRR